MERKPIKYHWLQLQEALNISSSKPRLTTCYHLKECQEVIQEGEYEVLPYSSGQVGVGQHKKIWVFADFQISLDQGTLSWCQSLCLIYVCLSSYWCCTYKNMCDTWASYSRIARYIILKLIIILSQVVYDYGEWGAHGCLLWFWEYWSCPNRSHISIVSSVPSYFLLIFQFKLFPFYL